MSVRDGQRLAVLAEALFLVNLMLLPVLAFLLLAFLYWHTKPSASPLARNHLRQAFFASVLGGLVLIAVLAGIVSLGDTGSGYTWVVVILYFTLVHTSLILFGAIGLSKALAGVPVRYPVIGGWFLRDDERGLFSGTRDRSR